MNADDLENIINSYNGFDGAIVLEVGFETMTSPSERNAWITLHAFFSAENAFNSGWKKIKIAAREEVSFSWRETPKNTNLVLNYPAEIKVNGKQIFLDFDPLHAKISDVGIILSDFYIGGNLFQVENI